MNKYERWYAAITARDDDAPYTEKHHILPRSMGGSNAASNLVRLTPRKHFVAHWLLTKITTGRDRHRMLNALNCMRRLGKIPKTSWRYAVGRTAMHELMIGKKHALGYRHTDDAKERIRAAGTGRRYPNRKLSESHKEKVSASLLGNRRKAGFQDPAETRLRKQIANRSNNKPQSNNKLGLRGVYFDQTRGLFRSRTKVDGKIVDLGFFECPAAARLAYIVCQEARLLTI